MKKLLALGLVLLTLILPITSLAYEASAKFAIYEFHTMATEQAVTHELMLFSLFSAPDEVGLVLIEGNTASGGYPTLIMIMNDFGIRYYLEDDAAATTLMGEAEKIFGECTLTGTTVIYLDFINENFRQQGGKPMR